MCPAGDVHQKESGRSAGSEPQKLLLRRIDQTKSLVLRVDLFSVVMALLTCGCSFLLGGILLDHLWTGGLPKTGRILYTAVSVAVLFVFFLARLIPLLRRRINPFYAADILEKNQPSLQNALINWLGLHQVKEKPRSVLEMTVRDGLTAQAAEGVKPIRTETAVDSSPLLRWGITLAAVVAVLCVYAVLSVKSPFISASRILFPMSDIDPPQRVRFVSIAPGDASFYRGASVPVRAEIAGVKGAPVRFVWGTTDRRKTGQEVVMNPVGGNLYELDFPPDGSRLEESLFYQIKVGTPGRRESTSPEFRLDVRPPLSFDVESVTYDYPPYTGREPETRKGIGTVEAVPGTAVTIQALCSEPVGKGFFVPDFSLNRAALMTIDPENPKRASYTWKLRESNRAGDGGELRSEYGSYRLMVSDADGVRNMEEPENPENGVPSWEIRLLPDQPPVIDWTDALPDEITVGANEKITIQAKAHDPDFALRRITLFFEYPVVQGEERIRPHQEIPPVELLEPVIADGPAPHTGEVTVSKTFSPSELGLIDGTNSAGTTIEFYLAAEDSRIPNPNQAKTRRRKLTITGSAAIPPDESKTEEENPESGEKQEGDSSSEEGENSDQSDSSDQQGEEGQPSGAGDKENETGGQEKGGEESPQQQENGEESGDPQAGSDGESGNSEKNQGANDGSGNSGSPDSSDSSSDSASDSSDSSDGSDNSGGENSNGEGKGEADNSDSSDSGTGDSSDNPSKSDNNGSKSDSPQENSQKENGNNSSSGGSAGENGENPDEESPSSPEETEPIDPEMNPGDAFEKILDHCAAAGGKKPPMPNPNAPVAGGDTGSGNPSDEKSENPDSLPAGTGTLPDDAPRQNDPNPSEIPADAERQQGEVDPATQNYMATSGEASNEAAPLPADAQTVMDPNSAVSGTPASEADRESSLNSNSTADGPREGAVPADSPNPQGDNPNSSDSRRSDMNGNPTAGAGPDTAGGEPSDTGNENPVSGDSAGSDGESSKGNSTGSSDQPGNSSQPHDGQRGGGGADRGNQTGETSAGPADAAHLEYSEAATALALEHLDDQLANGPDEALLKDLGWTKEELAAFARHWKQMKESIKDLPAGDIRRREYNDELLNMGLWETPPSDRLRGEAAGNERRKKSAVLNSPKSAPPAAMTERFRAYTEGIAKKKKK